jgi:hypothetical protein
VSERPADERVVGSMVKPVRLYGARRVSGLPSFGCTRNMLVVLLKGDSFTSESARKRPFPGT